jgi:protocatechuate 3,4-dioxygenase beta subunit
MNSLLRLVSSMSILLAGLVVAGAPPAAADTVLEDGQTLPLSGYAAHVVDESRGRIYVTAGPGDNRMAVTDLQGRPVQTVEGLTGASSMALSDDGTSLFVALETHRVVRLDAGALTVEQTYELPDFQRVIDLAWAGDRLWVAARSGCCTDTVYSLDPTTDERRPVTGLQGSVPTLTSTANGRLLVLMGSIPGSNEKVFLVDTGSGAVVATRVFENRAAAVGTSSTGQPYVLTDRVGYRLVSLNPDTLATVRSTGLASTSAVDTDGTIAVSSTGNSSLARGVDVRDAHTSSQLNRYRLSDVSDEFPLVLATVLTSAGLVVIHRGSEPVVASHVSDPSVLSSTLSVDPSPPEAFVGRETTLTGTLTDRGTPIAGAEVQIVDQPGVAGNGEPTRTRTVTTAGDGTFSFPYTPRTWNDIITYEYAGDDVHPAAWQQVRSNFALQPTNLSLDYNRTPDPGEPITFTGTLTALGEPIPGAEIEVEQWCTFDGPFTIRTDEAGRFDLTATPARCREDQFSFFYEGSWTHESLWTLRQVQPTWATSETTLVQPVEDAAVGSTWDWTGTVMSAGSAAPDVPVTYTIWRDFPNTKVSSGTTRTDASGGFRIVETFDQPGIYTLIAGYEGDATTLGSSDSDEFQVTRFPTTLTVDDADIGALPEQEITIGGRVTTADGTALADHPIEISYSGTVIAPLRTDADGRFEFQTVPRPPQGPNDQTRIYDVDVVQDDRYATAHATVRVTVAPERTQLVLDNVPLKSAIGDEITLGGRLTTGNGEPLVGHEVVLTHQDGEVHTLRAVTDAQGRFSVDTVIRTGQHQFLTARFAGTRTWLASDSSADWNSTPLPGVLTLKKVPPRLLGESISLTGRLTDADGNGEETWIDFSRINEAGQTDWERSVRTAADGSFSLPVQIEQVGRYTFLARSELWRVAQQSRSIVVEVRRLRLTTTALRPDAVRRGWSVYDAGQDPVVRTSTNPARGGLCVAHEVERLTNGTWRPVTTPQCKDTSDAGTVSQRIDVRHPAGSRFRVRAVRESATTTVGGWELIRFQ